MNIRLGDEVEDVVSGFKGIAVCRANWLHGCVRIGIKPRILDKDSRPCEVEFFDLPSLRVIGPGINEVLPKSTKTGKTGGPNRERFRTEGY